MYIPVVSMSNKPLMPTTPARARKWLKSGKAVAFWKKGIFCVRLNQISANYTQKIVVGIDTGSKKEAFTVKSKAHTYLNIQADAVTWVKDAIEQRRIMRRNRRRRKTPYRARRVNRAIFKKEGRIPPSTLARWNSKLRIFNILYKVFPISSCVVEDISARSKKGNRHWNKSFSPLEVGKKYFYRELLKLCKLRLKSGYQTFKLREQLGLKKSLNKLGNEFSCHCVDSWILAFGSVGGPPLLDNTEILFMTPLLMHRRQLHVLQPSKSGKRKTYGGTKSQGFKRGSLITHIKYGLTYVGGTSRKLISLHDVFTGKRLTQTANPRDCRFLSFNSWRWNYSKIQ